MKLAYERWDVYHSILDLVLPSETPGVLFEFPSDGKRPQGRRFHSVEFKFQFFQWISSGLWGYLSVLVVGSGLDSGLQFSFALSVSIASIVHTQLSCLEGKSQELNPARYQNTGDIYLVSDWTHFLDQYQQSCIFSAICFLICSIALNIFQAEMFGGFCLTFFATFYVTAIDTLIKFSLMKSDLNLEMRCAELSPEFHSMRRDELLVALESTLFHDHRLIQSVQKRNDKSADAVKNETNEMMRHRSDSEEMSKLLVQVNAFDTGVSGDVLRLLLLETIGGLPEGFTKDRLLGASARHIENLARWINQESHKITVAPLVRALCAYVAGVGVVLRGEMLEGHTAKLSASNPAKSTTWYFPPGMVLCGKYALVAATRFVVSLFEWKLLTILSLYCLNISFPQVRRAINRFLLEAYNFNGLEKCSSLKFRGGCAPHGLLSEMRC